MISTSAGSTPGTPPSRIPLPPYTFSRYFAPSCTAIRPVRDPRAEPRPLLHEHAVPVAHQRLDPRGHQCHSVLGGFDLFWHTDNHAPHTPFRDGLSRRLFVTSFSLSATPLTPSPVPTKQLSAAPAQRILARRWPSRLR